MKRTDLLFHFTGKKRKQALSSTFDSIPGIEKKKNSTFKKV